MEKLLKLLNEYDKEKGLHTFWKKTQSNKIQIYGKGVCSESYLYSKSYGFIKRLVDNDKIDIKEIQYFGTDDMKEAYSIEESLLMLLAISDTPIDDLISYLK